MHTGTYADPKVKAFLAKNFICAVLDPNTPGKCKTYCTNYEKIVKEWGVKDFAYPTAVLLSKDGKKVLWAKANFIKSKELMEALTKHMK